MKPVYAEYATVDGACGVGSVFEFTYQGTYNNWGREYHKTSITKGTKGGCGYLCAGFIEGYELCDDAFAQLSEKYNVVYISDVRKNVNSGNDFYFAVFDCADADVPIGFDAMEDS